MIVQVQCFADGKADERPVRFRIGDRDYMVEEIIGQWSGPYETYHRVRADDRKSYLLRHHTSTRAWSIEAAQKLR